MAQWQVQRGIASSGAIATAVSGGRIRVARVEPSDYLLWVDKRSADAIEPRLGGLDCWRVTVGHGLLMLSSIADTNYG